jgi:hypothetical protein
MNTKLLSVMLPAALLLGACASDNKPAAKQIGEQRQTDAKRDGIFFKKRPSWWNGKFDPYQLPAFRGLRKGRGLLSGDDGEMTIYSEPTRGSADPTKPEKVRR